MGGFGAPFVLILLPGVIWASLAYVHGSASLMAGELKHSARKPRSPRKVMGYLQKLLQWGW